MSLRNRELLNLVVVGALTALGFASVYIARQSVVSTGELTVDHRMDIRMATTFAIHEARSVADVAWEIAGAHAIFQSGAFESPRCATIVFSRSSSVTRP